MQLSQPASLLCWFEVNAVTPVQTQLTEHLIGLTSPLLSFFLCLFFSPFSLPGPLSPGGFMPLASFKSMSVYLSSCLPAVALCSLPFLMPPESTEMHFGCFILNVRMRCIFHTYFNMLTIPDSGNGFDPTEPPVPAVPVYFKQLLWGQVVYGHYGCV